MNDSFKMFVIALVTAVATQLLLAPYILKLQGFQPAPQAAAPLPAPAAAPPAAAPSAADTLTAPNLEGLSVDAARERWRAKNITIIEDAVRTDSGATPGTIVQQRPAPGETLDSKEIRVTVAQAGEALKVPDVIGKALAEARTELVDAGFEVPTPTTKAPRDDTADGVVMSMDPNAGAQAAKGSVVRLTVAKADRVAVPKLTGMSLSKAKKLLKAGGFSLGKVRRIEHPERGGGQVLRQDPVEGTQVAVGSVIALVVVAPD